MTEPGVPSFDSLRIFLTVVDAGSFAAAGRRLNRAVSVISYGVANLEAQLGLTLFTRDGARRPELTEAGKAVLAEARTISSGMDALRAKARGLLSGLEAELSVAVDVLLPPRRLGAILRAFASTYPTVTLRLHVEALGAVATLVLEGHAAFGISGPLASDHPNLVAVSAGGVEMVPVAAPGHPLARATVIAPNAAQEHLQLVLTDRSRATEGRDFAVVSARTWRLGDLGAKHELLREGIGWGNMPLPLVERDLASGTLKLLTIPGHQSGTYAFSGIWRRDHSPGPAASWLLERFATEMD